VQVAQKLNSDLLLFLLPFTTITHFWVIFKE